MVPHLARMGFAADMDSGDGVTRTSAQAALYSSSNLGIGLVSGKDGILYTINLGKPR